MEKVFIKFMDGSEFHTSDLVLRHVCKLVEAQISTVAEKSKMDEEAERLVTVLRQQNLK